MTTCLEFEDKTVQKATEKAINSLNIPKDKLKIDIISYGSSGIFGLVGMKKAKIRVTIPDNHHFEVPDSIAEESEIPVAEKKNADAKRVSSIVQDVFNIQTKEPGKNQVEPETQPSLQEEDLDEISKTAEKTLVHIISHITEDANVSVEAKAETIIFNIEGGNSGVLIGKRGQTLEALQYLLEKIVNKTYNRRMHIQIDVEGYLAGRKNRLKSMAQNISKKVKRTGKPVTLGQMNAHDRRVVHIALKDDNNVKTQSMGHGFYRKLIIIPKRSGNRKRKQSS